MTFNKKLKWFTLVEMLIVIVIIWVLAAALIPRLTSVRWRANDVARKADIQQLATAIITYQMDFNWVLPSSGWATEPIAVDSIADALKTAWMDGVPRDPVPSTTITRLGGDLATAPWWSYWYMKLEKDWIGSWWFVIISKTQTAWWSNRLIQSWATTLTWWFITPSTDISTLEVCREVKKSSNGTSFDMTNWTCVYDSADELFYIMAR